MSRLPGSFGRDVRERGNVLIVCFLIVTLLSALATAHFAMVQKNSRQSQQYNNLGKLRRYAETGVNLALHELNYDTGGNDGNIGTELWTPGNDVGRDGRPGTHDEGEYDSMPTPGEPNLIAAPIGPAPEGIGLFVQAVDTSWPKVKRIVSTAFNAQTYATVEVYARESSNGVPGVGAVYVQPGLILDLKGNTFIISGNDTNPDRTPGPNPAVPGIATSPGDPVGENAQDLIDQIPTGREDQVIGLGADPSIQETGAADFDAIFNAFKASRTNVIAPGTYDSVSTWGNYAANDFRVTYCNGDIQLSGQGKGAGALVIEGSLTITGKFEFVGLVIVRGDVRLSGGGSGIHLFGSAMIGQTLSAIDPDMNLNMSGNADIYYSSVGLTGAMNLLGTTFSVLYWNDLK